MSSINVFMNLTLDGVMQGPAHPEEDRRDGFAHGGWAVPYGAMQSSEADASLPGFDALLMGRRTYENFYGYWPHQTDSPFSEILNNMPKYVASRTLREPLPWMNSTLLKGNLSEAIAELKQEQAGKHIVIMGSGELVQSLMQHNLIDRYVLLIHPMVLGSGRRLFTGGGASASLHLINAQAIRNGVVLATYQPTEATQ